jgi:4-amino-4-deoxy-L-arabinose transferase-like glycosyltransferase
MESIKPILGGVAVCLGLAAYIIYIHSTLKNKTKPHAFSWLLWTLTTAIVFTAQAMKGGGAGSWSTGFTCTVCLAIGIISLIKYDKAYTLSDILFISVALLALLPWFFTKNPTASVY